MPTDPDQINANQDEEKQASASGKPAPKVQDNENLADDTADLMTGQLKSPLTENPPPNTIQLLLPLPASNTFGTPLFMHAVEFSISSVILIPCQLRILKWKSVKFIQTVQVHTRTWIDGAAK
jgi:hypothetical protein